MKLLQGNSVVLAMMVLLLVGCAPGDEASPGNGTPDKAYDDFTINTVEDFLYYVDDGTGAPLVFTADDGEFLVFLQDGRVTGGNNTKTNSGWDGTWSFNGGKLSIDAGPIKGTHFVGYFPDDGALVIRQKDYYRTFD